MDIEGLEVKITGRKNKITTYWKDGVIVGRKCINCGQDKEINEFSPYRKGGKTYKAECKDCKNERTRIKTIINENGVEVVNKFGAVSYWRNGEMIARKCNVCGKDKTPNEFRLQGKYYHAVCKECTSKIEKDKRKKPIVINEKGLEVRTASSKYGKTITYWDNGIMVARKCTNCGQDKGISEFCKSDGECKECKNKKRKNKRKKPIVINEKGWEVKVTKGKSASITYWKDGIMVARKCNFCGQDKEISEFTKTRCKECAKEYRINNKDRIKEVRKHWEEANKELKREKDKIYHIKNRERCNEVRKVYRARLKDENIKKIVEMVEQINPTFKQLNLPVYGYIYVFENIKTGRRYVGQSINPIKMRYNGSNIVRGWIKERLEKDTQKFKEELIETDIKVTEVLDVAFCQYHLDKLEAYYINKYDSFLNGYNNQEGNHITDDGIEEFNQILLENNLEFIDGKLVKIA